jgi:site-specific DNA-methyltransferase (adenine-specific)
MEGPEFDELCRDISANGLIEPIWTYQGKILDGRNRYRACMKVGIAPQYREYTGDNPLSFVISLNLKRRHLNESQRAIIAAKLANMQLGDNQYKKEGVQICTPKISLEQAAELLNVGRRTVAMVKAIEREAPELVEKIERGEMTAHEAEKKVKEKEREQRRAELARAAEQVPLSERWRIWQDDIHTARLDEQVDAIITDPPYPKDYLPLWDELGRFAKENLKTGGVLLAMAPGTYLPQVIEMLGRHLTYQWVLACELPGQSASAIQSGVRNIMWKPILVYRNGGDPINIGCDLFRNTKREKEFHEWGQGVDGYEWQVENFTLPNDIICDPFLGGGTTAIAALKHGRRFVGFDVDAESVSISKGRLKDCLLDLSPAQRLVGALLGEGDCW